MAEFITKCPHCNNNLQVQDEWIGMELECPQCRQKFVLAPGETAKPPFESDEKNCPFCGETIKKQAVYCKHCKTDFTQTAQRSINPFVPFLKFCDFYGRATRSEFWWFYLVNLVISFIPFIGWMYNLIALIPLLAVTVRRLHDTGRSGWNCFWIFLPIFGPIFLLVFLCEDSVPGVNQYGHNPKGIGNDIQSYPSTPSDAVINESAPSVLEIILFAIGILIISISLVFCILSIFGFASFFTWKLLSWIRAIFALIGCIISIIYFVVQDVRARKIHWEYLGIVMSFEHLFVFIVGLTNFVKLLNIR